MQLPRPINPRLLRHYAERRDAYNGVADALGVPRFSESLRHELVSALHDADAVSLVEAVARVGDYVNPRELSRQKVAVSRLLKRDGVRLPRGKRPAPELEALVSDLAPLFLHYGIPLATGERSKLVTLLRSVASELGVRGDPRDELRRLGRLAKAQTEATRRMIYAALAEGLKPLGDTS